MEKWKNGSLKRSPGLHELIENSADQRSDTNSPVGLVMGRWLILSLMNDGSTSSFHLRTLDSIDIVNDHVEVSKDKIMAFLACKSKVFHT